MIIYRLNGSLTKPWNIFQSELDEIFGGSKVKEEEYRWNCGIFRLYQLNVEADRSSGEMTATISTTFPYKPIALASLILMLYVGLFSTNIFFMFMAISICILCVLLPSVSSTIIFQYYLHTRTTDTYSVNKATISPVILFPIVGYVVGWWLLTELLIAKILVLVSVPIILGPAIYGSSLNSRSIREQTPLLFLAVLSGLPLYLAAGNFALIIIGGMSFSATLLPVVVGLLILNTIAVLGVYTILSRWFIDGIKHAPNEPFSSEVMRVLWGGYFFTQNILLLLFAALLILSWVTGAVLDFPVAEMAAGFERLSIPAPGIVTSGSLFILAFPLIALLLLWLWNIVDTTLSQKRLFAELKLVDDLDFEVPIWVIDAPQLFAHPINQLAGKKGVILSSKMIDELDEDELNAVIVHEIYHLQHRDPERNLIATLFGFLIGGRNALIVLYDYPKIEQKADNYAARRVGSEPLVRALRRLDAIRMSGAQSPTNVAPNFIGKRILMQYWWISYPYQVLFGSVILDHAHATTDERITRILKQDHS